MHENTMILVRLISTIVYVFLTLKIILTQYSLSVKLRKEGKKFVRHLETNDFISSQRY